MSQLALYLFGPPRLERDGVPAQFPHRKAMALLSYLAVTRQSYSRDSLAALLWPENDPPSARGGLRRMLSEIKGVLGEGWLTADRENAQLTPEKSTGNSLSLDVVLFQEKLKLCEAHNHLPTIICDQCIPTLEEAVELYQDDFMAGFSLKNCLDYDEWQFFQREELRTQLANALQRLSSYYEGAHKYEKAIRYARRWLALDLLNEPAHQRLMDLYERSGQRSAALRQYQVCREMLAEELGVKPSEETKDLYQKIQVSTVAASREIRQTHNLPVQATSFIGRVDELAEIRAKLKDEDSHLLTLLGPGGSGKTRLAIEAAGGLLEDFKHGAFFINLAPLQDAEGIPAAIATALKFSFSGQGTPEEQLLDYLQNKEMLLILDNFEHLLDGVRFVNQVMSTSSEIKILATSRIRLMVTGEHIYDVWGMAYPEAFIPLDIATQQYNAIKLFESEASRVRGDFRLKEDNLEDVIEVCSLLEGMPLGIVLAANWVTMLTPAEIAAEITSDLAFLEEEMSDLPQRQRGMQSTFNYSWRFLNEGEREIMRALSVFRGGFTRDAAQAITGASLRDLKGLTDKSMLLRTSSGRYEMHELVRQYAAEKLAMVPATELDIKVKHSNYFCNALAVWERHLQGPRQAAANQEMKIEMGNIQTAWRWGIENLALKSLLDGINGLCVFFFYNGQSLDGEAACLLLLERLEALGISEQLNNGSNQKSPTVHIEFSKLQARVLAWGGLFNNNKEFSHKLLQKCLSVIESDAMAGEDTRLERATAYCVLPLVIEFTSPAESIQLVEEGLQIFKSLDELWCVGNTYSMLSHLAHSIFDFEKQKYYREESLAVRRKQGDLRGIAEILVNLAWDTPEEKAEEILYEALAISTELDDRSNIVLAYIVLGWHWINQGKFREARSLYSETLGNYGNLNFTRNGAFMIHTYTGFPDLHLRAYQAAQDKAEYALVILTEAKEYSDLYSAGLGIKILAGLAIQILGDVKLAQGAYSQAESRFQECLNIFQNYNASETINDALTGLGFATRGLNQVNQSHSYFCQALRVALPAAIKVKYVFLVRALSGIALLFADQGDIERAVELYALASTFGIVANSKWFADIAGDEIAKAAEGLPEDVVEAAKARGQELDLWETAEKLLVEFEEMGWC